MDVRGIIQGITYKPGWTLAVASTYSGDFTVTVKCDVPDVDCPQMTTQLQMQLMVDSHMSEKEIVLQVHEAILKMEHYELDKWLKYRGGCVYTPHPLP